MSTFRLFVLPAAIVALTSACGNDPVVPEQDDGRLEPQDQPAAELPVDDLEPPPPDLEEDPNPAADKPAHGDEEEDPPVEEDPPTSGPPPPGAPPPPPPPGAPPPPTTACADEDAFEPNDEQTQARTVSVGTAVTAFACPADPDWFAVDVQAGCSITVATTFVNAEGDLDIALYAPDGTEVASSNGVADDETVTFEATTTGKYAVEVMPYGDDQNAFTLTTSVDCAGVTPPPATTTCTADADVDTSAAAAPITTSAAGVSGVACTGDKDWFKIDVAAGCTVRGALSLTNADGDIDLVLENEAGTRLASSMSYADLEEVEAVFAAAGQARFGVFGYGAADNDYALRVTLDCPVTTPALTCPADDEFEPNDDAYWALSIFDDETLHGIVCSNDQDVWALQVPDACAAVVELAFTHANGDLDMSFHGPDGALMDSSTGATNTERIVEVANESGEHFIRVAGYNGAQNEYDVSVSTVCREDFSCPADDMFEPNDARSAAVHLDGFDRAIGMTCGDDDWYYVDAQPGCMVYADLMFSDAEGDLDLEIVDGANTVVGESSGTGDVENADTYVYVAGKIAIRVVPYNGAQARYLLETAVYCP